MDIGPVAVEQGLQLADRDRPAEDEALNVGEAGFAGVAQLFLGLDPLGHRLHLQRGGQIGDGLGNRPVAGIFADALRAWRKSYLLLSLFSENMYMALTVPWRSVVSRACTSETHFSWPSISTCVARSFPKPLKSLQ